MKIIFSIVLLTLMIDGYGQETIQWRGPTRDGIYPEKGLLRKWPEGGPELKLRISDLGSGYSQPIVYKDNIYVTGLKKDSLDVISAFDMSGKLLWNQVYGHAWINSYPGTRCTPTIQNDKIYLITGMGEICCLDAENGSVLWSQDAQNQFNGMYHSWGISESVLLTDRAALYVTGGEETTVVAYDKNSGNLLWKTKSLGGLRAYASSLLIERGGLQIILAQTMNDLIGINAADGEILWTFDLQPYQPGERGKGVNTNTPIYHNGEIFQASGYDHFALMISLAPDGRSVALKWKNDTIDIHHGGAVLVDGNLYGTNWLTNTKGEWVSVDWETGKTNWVKDWIAKGSVIFADGLLYCYEERSGTVALVQPDPTDFKIISTFKVEGGEGPYWAHPSIYNDCLYLRHGNILLIYNIKA